MTATTSTEDAVSITAVSSPSARRLYYALAEAGEATFEELVETVGHDADRVRDLLAVLDSRGLLTENDGTYAV